MTDDRSSFRNILRAIFLFGGVQFYQIIVSIIRSKIVAVLLGPEGIGILGLLNSTTGLIQRGTNFGLNISAVRDLAEANGSGNQKRISQVIIVLHRLILITGFLGLILTLVLSPWLSEVTFGSNKYTLAFIWLALTLLFSQLTAEYFVVLQGLGKLRFLAMANLIGVSSGLIIGLPLYYFWGLDAIVPNIIIGSLSSLIISWFYKRKMNIPPLQVSCKKTYIIGKKMIILGFFLNVTAFIVLANDYALRLFISNFGDVTQVGLYTAGFAILNNYVGLIFSAMSTEYYPRLSGVAKDNVKCCETINHQAEVSIIIITPLIIAFILFSNWGLVLLFSNKFVPVNEMLKWAGIGILSRTAAWTLGYVYIARGDSKLFITVNITHYVYVLIFNIIAYYYYGLTGLGISFSLTNIINLLINVIVSKRYYNFKFSPIFSKLFLYNNFFVMISFCLMVFSDLNYKYFYGLIILAIASIYSLFELNIRVNLTEAVKNYINIHK